MTNTPQTDPVSFWPSNDLPPKRLYAPGVQEEKVVRFGLPPMVSRTFYACALGAHAELLVEDLGMDCNTLRRMSALTFATVQRIAHDPAETGAWVLAALTRSPLAHGMIRSFSDIVAVAGDSYRELRDIQTGRLLTWVSTLRTISGWNGQTDADRDNED